MAAGQEKNQFAISHGNLVYKATEGQSATGPTGTNQAKSKTLHKGATGTQQ